MPIYQFSATSPEGKMESGLMQGASFDSVVAQLSAKGFSVEQVSLAPTVGDPLAEPSRAMTPPPTDQRSRLMTEVVAPLIGPVGLPALQFFFRQLGTMLHAGIGSVQALETLSRQTQNPVLRSILTETKDHVIAGREMSVGLQRYPEVFTPLMLGLFRAGEEGGFLSSQCMLLSDYIQRDVELRNMIRRETAYPKFVLGASVFIILGANAAIATLAPGRTGIAAPVGVWLLAAIFGAGGFFFARVGLRNPQTKFAWDTMTLQIPGIGGMVNGFAMARFGRAFGALYKGGVAVPRALELAADACGNEALRLRMYGAVSGLKEGRGITECFAETQAFSPLVLDMSRTGEMTGNMDEMLIKVAEYYEDEGQTKAKQSATILGILCIVLLAIYVLYIAVSFYSGYGQGLSQAADSGGG